MKTAETKKSKRQNANLSGDFETGETDCGSKDAAIFSIRLDRREAGSNLYRNAAQQSDFGSFRVNLPVDASSLHEEIEPSLPDGPSFLRRSVVGSISNRGRNYEPARLRSFCGQQNLKSHGVPGLIGGACRCMAAHMERLPRLTLKVGRRAGCQAGSPRDGRADRRKTHS